MKNDTVTTVPMVVEVAEIAGWKKFGKTTSICMSTVAMGTLIAKEAQARGYEGSFVVKPAGLVGFPPKYVFDLNCTGAQYLELLLDCEKIIRNTPELKRQIQEEMALA